MKKYIKNSIAITLLILVGLFALGIPSNKLLAKELKLAHFMPPVHILHRNLFVPMSDEIAKATNGEVTIKIYAAGALGKGPVQQYKRVVDGVADITFGIQSYTAKLFPRSLLVAQVGVGRSAEESTVKMWKVYDQYLAEEYKAIKVLAAWAHAATVLITRNKPVRTVDDMKGMKIRVGSPLISPLIKAWGGVPVVMPVTKTYNALSTGVVDAVLIQPSAIYRPWKLGEPGKYVTDGFPSPSTVFFIAMNKNSWAGLSKEQQTAIGQIVGGQEFSLRAAKVFGDAERAAIAKARKDSKLTVIDVTPEAAKEFGNAAKPAIEEELTKLEKMGIDGRAIYNALTQ